MKANILLDGEFLCVKETITLMDSPDSNEFFVEVRGKRYAGTLNIVFTTEQIDEIIRVRQQKSN